MQVQSLQSLVHQSINYAEERSPQGAGVFSDKLSGIGVPRFFSSGIGNVAGWVGLIVLIFGLSSLMAYFMISMINRPETAATPFPTAAPVSTNTPKDKSMVTPPQEESQTLENGITNHEPAGASSSPETTDSTAENSSSDAESMASKSSSSGNRRRITSPAGNFRRMR